MPLSIHNSIPVEFISLRTSSSFCLSAQATGTIDTCIKESMRCFPSGHIKCQLLVCELSRVCVTAKIDNHLSINILFKFSIPFQDLVIIDKDIVL